MSTPQNIKNLVSENDVQQYLRDNVDFFQVHSQLLSDLRIPHSRGKAVSLVERQVAVLRDQKKQLKKQLQDLVQIARENDSLNQQLHTLMIELYKAKTIDDVVDVVQARLKSEYGVDECQFLFFKSEGKKPVHSSVRLVDSSDNGCKSILKILREQKPVCGHFNVDVTGYLFADNAKEIKSVAMLPLVSEKFFGVLSLGSYDAQRFHAEKATDFLKKLSELVGCVLTYKSSR